MISSSETPPAASATIAQAQRLVAVPKILVPAVTMLCLAAVPLASAQDASNWDGQTHSAARLIAGAMSKNRDTAFLRAGIEIKLDPGWQTYWRDPGDSGAPPMFDFTGSENVKTV